MRHIAILIATITLLLTACENKQANPDEVMGNAAKIYYHYLLEGKYEAYVDGFYQPDSIPGSYREQLITNAKMFKALMTEQHKGLKSVALASAKADTAHHVGHAFLIMHFGDGTKEEIVVPMTEHQGKWMLR